MLFLLDAADAYDHYLSRVERLIKNVTGDDQVADPAIGRVRDLFRYGRGTMADEAYCPPLGYDIGTLSH